MIKELILKLLETIETIEDDDDRSDFRAMVKDALNAALEYVKAVYVMDVDLSIIGKLMHNQKATAEDYEKLSDAGIEIISKYSKSGISTSDYQYITIGYDTKRRDAHEHWIVQCKSLNRLARFLKVNEPFDIEDDAAREIFGDYAQKVVDEYFQNRIK